MSVLLPNTTLGLRRRVESEERNSYGERTSASWGPLLTLLDGLAVEANDATWTLGLDPAQWPVRKGDLVLGSDGSSWLISTAELLTNSYDDTVDWVRATANLRVAGGTEPGGTWFAGRYAPDGQDADPQDPDSPVHLNGHGPPDPLLVLPFGSTWSDVDSGIVYRFDESEV